MKKITRKTVTMAAAALMTMSALTGCSGKQAVQAVDLTAVSFDEIQKKASEEGQIASVGMPDDWANWKGSWEAITEKYGLKHEDTDMSSAEELSTFDSEKDAPTKDMCDVGQAF